MQAKPDTEFVLWTIHAEHKVAQKPLYKIPENVVEMHEIFLEDAFHCETATAPIHQKEADARKAMTALGQFLAVQGNNWSSALLDCRKNACSVDFLAKSEAFLDFAAQLSQHETEPIGLSDAFYGLRSMLLPILYILRQPIPQADIYHAAVTGYGGLLGAMAHLETGKPFVLTEHGIYPREREEELMQAEWVPESMKDIWIRLFYNLSRCAYAYAEVVTSLFRRAMERECEIGCEKSRCRIVPNGIHYERFGTIEEKRGEGPICIGAFIRFAPIKDVKTLIRAFYSLSCRVPQVKLFVLGGTDDPEYKRDCLDLIERLHVKNLYIEGYVNTAEYLQKVDFTVMTSISEGQPLAILESLAAGRPCVTTNVGNCGELLERPEDEFGPAGICCAPMDTTGLANAMETMCCNARLRREYGQNGRQRVAKYYTHAIMMERYFSIYEEVLNGGRNRV
jgi:glycosyltransferase involved in cell wall biosynthesis